MFKTIVVAYDGSDHAKRAIKTACDVAKHYEAALWLSHTPESASAPIAVDPFIGAIGAPLPPEEIAAAAKAMTDEADALVKAEGCTLAGIRTGSVTPAEDIAALAKDVKADLIVLGRRGRGAVTGLLFGSVTQEVSKAAPCAVLTVV
ncbi:universal stress protein [Pikeienuella sp. HZG-20]|uniref:universal stress protein n=1 Tax=Paludibacillus litoralis TaxID=3133267 RepID=UPI0030EE3C42